MAINAKFAIDMVMLEHFPDTFLLEPGDFDVFELV